MSFQRLYELDHFHPPVREHRTVLISSANPHEVSTAAEHATPTLTDVEAALLELDGRAPIRLERLRATLRYLQRLMTPHDYLRTLCPTCAAHHYHTPTCQTAKDDATAKPSTTSRAEAWI